MIGMRILSVHPSVTVSYTLCVW